MTYDFQQICIVLVHYFSYLNFLPTSDTQNSAVFALYVQGLRGLRLAVRKPRQVAEAPAGCWESKFFKKLDFLGKM